MEDSDRRECTVIPPGEGPLFWMLTDWIQVKVGGQDTGGKLSIV